MAKAKSPDEIIDKIYGKYNDDDMDKTPMRTNLIVLDTVLNGGIPRGAMIELFSDSGLGKSTLVLDACAQLCRTGHKVLYLDFEGSVSESQLRGIGLWEFLKTKDNPEGPFVKFRLSTYDECDEVLDALLPTREFDFVVIDSITAIVNDKYFDEDGSKTAISAVRPGQDARSLSILLKKYTAFKVRYNTTFMMINQVRTAINMLGGPSRDESTGGNAMRFYPDVRLKLSPKASIFRSRETINGKEDIKVGAEVYLESVKNRVGPCFIKVPMTILFGRGVSNLATYQQWLQYKESPDENGELQPMLRVKGGGYNVLTINGKTYNARGQEALVKTIAEHMSEIEQCFSAEDFKLMRDQYGDYEEGEETRSVPVSEDDDDDEEE